MMLKDVRFDTTTTTTRLPIADKYACPPVPSNYDVVVTQEGTQWRVSGVGTTYTSVKAAIDEAFNRLNQSRNYKQSVLVHGSGTLAQESAESASCRISIPSFTVLNICGELLANCLSEGDRSCPLFSSGTEHIDIPNVRILGTAAFAVRFQAAHHIHMGRISIKMTRSAGAGIRLDAPDTRCPFRDCYTTFVHVDEVFVSGLSGHAVEAFNVSNMVLGTVVAERVGYCAVILNNATNIEVGSIYSTGSQWRLPGYAALRMANFNGRLNDGSYPINIHVGELISKNDYGRGLFCVSESGGAQIDYLSIEASNDLLINNCRNVVIGSFERRSNINNTIIFSSNSGDEMNPPVVFTNTHKIKIRNLVNFRGDPPRMDLSRNCNYGTNCPWSKDKSICGNSLIYDGSKIGC